MVTFGTVKAKYKRGFSSYRI